MICSDIQCVCVCACVFHADNLIIIPEVFFFHAEFDFLFFVRAARLNADSLYQITHGGLMTHAWSHPNLLCGSYFHDASILDMTAPPIPTSHVSASSPGDSTPTDSIFQTIGRSIRNGAIRIARRFCEYRAAQISDDMALALQKPEDPARLPRVFFVSLSWAAPPFEIEPQPKKYVIPSSVVSATPLASPSSHSSMEYRDHEMVIIKRRAKSPNGTWNASSVSSPRSVWPSCLFLSSLPHTTTVSDFEYELVQGYIADGRDASLSTESSHIESKDATSPSPPAQISDTAEFRGMDSERWHASGHLLAAPFGNVGMAQFLASVRRHAGAPAQPASVEYEVSETSTNARSGNIATGRESAISDKSVHGDADVDGARFCSASHRRWLGGSHERALDGRRGCWTGVSMRELRDEHIEFGPHYVHAESRDDSDGITSAAETRAVNDVGGDRPATGAACAGGLHSAAAENFDAEDEVHDEDEVATPVAWRLRAFRVQQAKLHKMV
jgi:hypothetical protein